jgi:hypothetical protein
MFGRKRTREFNVITFLFLIAIVLSWFGSGASMALEVAAALALLLAGTVILALMRKGKGWRVRSASPGDGLRAFTAMVAAGIMGLVVGPDLLPLTNITLPFVLLLGVITLVLVLSALGVIALYMDELEPRPLPTAGGTLLRNVLRLVLAISWLAAMAYFYVALSGRRGDSTAPHGDYSIAAIIQDRAIYLTPAQHALIEQWEPAFMAAVIVAMLAAFALHGLAARR